MKAKKMTHLHIILLALVFSVLIPVLLGCFYTVPAVDDFQNMAKWYADYRDNRFVNVLLAVKNEYLTWQGTYVPAFTTALPFYHWFGLPGLRLAVFFDTVFFLAALAFCTAVFTAVIGFRKENRLTAELLIYLTAIVYLLGTNKLTDLFYWYTGAQTYTLTLAFAFIAAAEFMRYEMQGKTRHIVIGAISAVIAAGAPTCIAAFLCAALLFGILYNYVVLKKIDKGSIIGLFALAGSVINAMAPGNFKRQQLYASGANPLGGIVKAVARSVYALFTDLRSGTLAVLIVVMFLFGYKYLRESRFEFRYPGWVTVYACFAVFITDFPTAYGYNSTRIGVRGEFVEHVAIALFFILLSLYWGGWCAKKELFEFTKTSMLIIAFVTVLFLSGPYAYNTFLNFTPYKMAVYMANGDMRELAEKDAEVIRQIEESDEADVVIRVPKDREGQWTNISRNPIVSGDAAGNKWFADWFGKKSILLEYID